MRRDEVFPRQGPRRRIVVQIFAVALLVGVIAQVYLAGLAFFSTGTFEAHAVVGWFLILVAAVLHVTILIQWRFAPMVITSGVVLVCIILQPILALWVRTAVPWLAAAHTVNALAIFWCATRVTSIAFRPHNESSAVTADATTGVLEAS